MNDIRFRKLVAVLSLFAASGALATVGFAQATTSTTSTTTTTTTTSEQAPEVLERYVVTGSNIPSAAEALAIPVAVLDTQVFADSGVNSDMLDILRKVEPNISGIGGENAQISTGSNFGGASVNLKGLPTLVLIDGRRVANDPAESTGGFQFVDLNLIPPAAVERIEVLQDGASAIYGSDAVGGVINVILKKDYNGWEMGGHYGYSTNTGHYSERSAYVVGGVSNDKTSITISLDYAEQDAMYLKDRPYTNPIYGTHTYPGSLEVYNNTTGDDEFYQLAAGLSAPPGGAQYTIQQLVSMGVYVPISYGASGTAFNLANGETLESYLKRYSLMANFDHKIFGNNLVGFGNVIASHTYTWTSLNAQPVVPYLEDPWVDVNVLGYASSPPPAGTTYVPVNAPGNPFSQTFLDQGQAFPESQPGYGDGSGYEILPRARFLAYPRLYQNDSQLFRIVGGFRGDITDDIHWEAAANIDRYTLNYTNPGLIDTDNLITALADGQINPFARVQAPGAFDGVIGTAFVNMLSTLQSFDAKLDGSLYQLPGGKLGFAVGVSYVREGLSAVPDVNSLPNSTGTTAGWSNATTFKQFSATRDVTSGFAELSIPVTGSKQNIPGAYSINVDGAVRYDDYSGKVGSTTDPQVNVSWAPVDDQFKLRASAGKSFIAPQLYTLYGPSGAGSTTSITYNVYNGGGGTKSAQFNETTGANPDLKPTTANSWTVGFVYTPKAVSGLSITVDYSDIMMKQIVGNVPANTVIQSVESLGSASPYENLVHLNTPAGPLLPSPGGVSSHSPQQIYVILNSVNLSGEKVNSADFTIDYVKAVPGIGRFDITSVWTWYQSYKLELIPTEQYYEYAGTASQNVGSVPKWRTNTTFDWSNKGVDAFVSVTYVSSITDVGVGGDDQFGLESVSAFTAFDLGLSYDFKALHMSKWLDALKVTIGVNNVANKLPPEAINAFPNTNADVGTYDGAIGRMFYVNAKYSF
jgi:iron complex outermembrane receptor protein